MDGMWDAEDLTGERLQKYQNQSWNYKKGSIIRTFEHSFKHDFLLFIKKSKFVFSFRSTASLRVAEKNRPHGDQPTVWFLFNNFQVIPEMVRILDVSLLVMSACVVCCQIWRSRLKVVFVLASMNNVWSTVDRSLTTENPPQQFCEIVRIRRNPERSLVYVFMSTQYLISVVIHGRIDLPISVGRCDFMTLRSKTLLGWRYRKGVLYQHANLVAR